MDVFCPVRQRAWARRSLTNVDFEPWSISALATNGSPLVAVIMTTAVANITDLVHETILAWILGLDSKRDWLGRVETSSLFSEAKCSWRSVWCFLLHVMQVFLRNAVLYKMFPQTVYAQFVSTYKIHFFRNGLGFKLRTITQKMMLVAQWTVSIWSRRRRSEIKVWTAVHF